MDEARNDPTRLFAPGSDLDRLLKYPFGDRFPATQNKNCKHKVNEDNLKFVRKASIALQRLNPSLTGIYMSHTAMSATTSSVVTASSVLVKTLN